MCAERDKLQKFCTDCITHTIFNAHVKHRQKAKTLCGFAVSCKANLKCERNWQLFQQSIKTEKKERKRIYYVCVCVLCGIEVPEVEKKVAKKCVVALQKKTTTTISRVKHTKRKVSESIK